MKNPDLAPWVDATRAALTERVKLLIRGANMDLYCGPLSREDAASEGIDSWPGFVAACREIRDALDDVRTIWIDDQSGCWSDSEPQSDDLEAYWIVDRDELLRALVGRELARYV